MNEQLSPQPTAEQASRNIAADIRAHPPGPDMRKEHLRLYSGVISPDDINAAWADRYAEIAKIAKAKRDREKIEAKLAKFREEQKTKVGASSILPATQPTADEPERDNAARKAVIAKFVQNHRDDLAKRKALEEERGKEPVGFISTSNANRTLPQSRNANGQRARNPLAARLAREGPNADMALLAKELLAMAQWLLAGS